MILITTLLIALAAWRVWRLIAVDTITEPLRYRLAYDGHLANFISCPWCLGFWITVAATGLYWWLGNSGWSIVEAVLVAFAASALVGIINEADDRLLGQ